MEQARAPWDQKLIDDWGLEPKAPTQIADMDKLIQKLQAARGAYDEAKKVSTEKYHQLEEVEKEVINALKANGRTKFEAEGTALVYITTKEVYTTPKTGEQKASLFNYIENKYGADTLLAMQSINHNTLNSWANGETKEDPTLQIPGLDAPTSVETLNFRRK
jgi:hypothetical protein